MNLNKIITEETRKVIKEANNKKSLTETIHMIMERIDELDKNLSSKSERVPGRGREFKYGIENVGKANKARNNFELSTINAKKKGETAQSDDETSLVNAITQDGINTTEVCRRAGYPNPNNKASAIEKVRDGDKWGGGAEAGEKPKGKTAHLRQQDISKLTQAAQEMGIKT